MLPINHFFRSSWPQTRLWSLFDELDRPFLPLTWEDPILDTQPKLWTSSVHLHGFKADEIKTVREEVDGKQIIRVHAKHDDPENFTELRRNIHLPDEIDLSSLQVHFTKKGHLVVKAPYKQHEIATTSDVFSDASKMLEEGRSMLSNTKIVPDSVKGSEKYSAEFNVTGFKPEEVHVVQQGNRLVVEARQDQATENCNSFRHVRREVTLPEGVQAEGLVSALGGDGHLRIEAPYVRPADAIAEARKIPIEMDTTNAPVAKEA